MSHKRNHANVSIGGAGSQASSSSSARRPSSIGSHLKLEDSNDVVTDQSHPRRTSRSVDDADSDAGSDPASRARKKAEPVKSACVQCQKRKTKCSGQRPVCRFCSDRNLECSWDIGDGLTRTADLKGKLVLANGRSDDLDELVGAMRHGTDQTSTMLLAKLRMGDTLETLLSGLRLEDLPEDERESRDSQMTGSDESRPGQTAPEDPSQIHQQHEFDWPAPETEYHEFQPQGGWSTNAVPGFYHQTRDRRSNKQSNNQSNNQSNRQSTRQSNRQSTRQIDRQTVHQQQPPYFTMPDFDQSRMTWGRNDFYYSPDDSPPREMGTQAYSDAQRQDASTSSGVTLVPRGSVGDPSSHMNRPSSSRQTGS